MRCISIFVTRALAFVLLGTALAACDVFEDDDTSPPPPAGGQPPMDPPPEDPPPEDPPPMSDVSGTWEPEYTDGQPASASTLAACTGDLAGAEGTGSLPMGIVCASDDPILVSQNNADFEIAPVPCVDAPGAQALGSGTVTGDTLEGQFVIAGPDETQTVFFTGELASQRLTMRATRIEVSGARSGGCDIASSASSLILISQ